MRHCKDNQAVQKLSWVVASANWRQLALSLGLAPARAPLPFVSLLGLCSVMLTLHFTSLFAIRSFIYKEPA
jgi:hypothetical protein